MNQRLSKMFALFALSFALPAVAAQDCVPTTSSPEATVPANGRTFYVDNDLCQPGCIFSIWVYEESNGIDGLQRADEVVDDTCGGMIEGDTIIV